LDIAERLRQTGRFETVLSDSQLINVDITENMNKDKVIFKQMTWIPNEIPKSDLVIFTMIDRCVHPLCKNKLKSYKYKLKNIFIIF
jgi:hypothetical protein